jgi:hypothetical protein
MDDIVRHVKGVSDGLKRAVSTSSPSAPYSQFADNRMPLSWNQEEIDNQNLQNRHLGSSHSLSDVDSNCEDRPSSVNSSCHSCHSDNELNNGGYGSNDIKHIEACTSCDAQVNQRIEKPARGNSDSANMSSVKPFEDPSGIPPEVRFSNMWLSLNQIAGTSVLKVFPLRPKTSLLFVSGCQQM